MQLLIKLKDLLPHVDDLGLADFGALRPGGNQVTVKDDHGKSEQGVARHFNAEQDKAHHCGWHCRSRSRRVPQRGGR